jgi:hypothetical protein
MTCPKAVVPMTATMPTPSSSSLVRWGEDNKTLSRACRIADWIDLPWRKSSGLSKRSATRYLPKKKRKL